MKKYALSTTLILFLFLTACGQTKDNRQTIPDTITKKQQTMDLSKITDVAVRQAIEALQAGDQKWYTFFTEHPMMTDDGNPVNFRSFFANALGKEIFLSIDRVENDGKNIYGHFKAGQWGTFPVFFKFHKNEEGKFERLDIGQDK